MMLALLADSALRSIALGCVAGLCVTLLRVRHSQTRMIVWTVVLLMSMAIPVLTPWMRLTIPVDENPARSLPIAATDIPWMAPLAPLPALDATPAIFGSDAQAVEHAAKTDWRLLAAVAYISVAGVMMVRLLIGLLIMRRVVGAARPIRESWTAGSDVRASDVVWVPSTFASTILLPPASSAWSAHKRRAVLLHEQSHVAHGDFYVLLLAAIYRAVFWFNPFSWWLVRHLADLAEMVSDDTAAAGLDDRRGYTDILLDVARHDQRLPSTLAMARPRSVGWRVERVLAAGAALSPLSRRRRLLLVAVLVPLATLSAGTIARGARTPIVPFARVAPPSAGQLDRYVGHFAVTGAAILTVTREGEELVVQSTGQPKLRLIALSDHEFVTERGDVNLTFPTDGGPVAMVVLRKLDAGSRRCARIDAATAGEIEVNFERRATATPDRFREQTPLPGGAAAVRRMIEDLRHHPLIHERMSRQLAERVEGQAQIYRDTVDALGAVQSISFRGVGPGGYDIYGVAFANGLAEFRIDIAADGTIEDFNFRPYGDGTLGAITACAIEPTLKAVRDRAPIKLAIANRSGADMRLFWLDESGRRIANGTLENDRSTDMLTKIGRPLVIADQAGECREIIMPGLLTRVHAIGPPLLDDALDRSAALRSTPLTGSAEALQRHLNDIRRGAPDYARMTATAAASTRVLLPLQHAALAKLGALRAMSFRGVTQTGNDFYTVQFANGSAEWQIALEDGRIGSVALGPQY